MSRPPLPVPQRVSAPSVDLEGDEVHLWIVPVSNPPVRMAELEAILADDERNTASRFKREEDRLRFTVGRGALRLLLGAYLDQHAARIPIVCMEPYGKPELAPGSGVSPGPGRLRFNVAHSGDYVVIGATRDRAIGVDVERFRAVRDMDALAQRFFAPAEAAALAATPTARRQAAFFACWTRKEAFVKAVGAGISYPLHRFVVNVEPDALARLLELDGSPETAGAWRLWSLAPAPGYLAAAAVESRDARLLVHRWSAAGVERVLASGEGEQ